MPTMTAKQFIVAYVHHISLDASQALNNENTWSDYYRFDRYRRELESINNTLWQMRLTVHPDCNHPNPALFAFLISMCDRAYELLEATHEQLRKWRWMKVQ